MKWGPGVAALFETGHSRARGRGRRQAGLEAVCFGSCEGRGLSVSQNTRVPALGPVSEQRIAVPRWQRRKARLPLPGKVCVPAQDLDLPGRACYLSFLVVWCQGIEQVSGPGLKGKQLDVERLVLKSAAEDLSASDG